MPPNSAEQNYEDARRLFPFAGLLQIDESQTPMEYAARFIGQLLQNQRLPSFETLSATNRSVYAHLIATLEGTPIDPRFASNVPNAVATLLEHVKSQLQTGAPQIIAANPADPLAHLQKRERIIHGKRWSEYQIALELQRIARLSTTLGGDRLNTPQDLISLLLDYPIPELWHLMIRDSAESQLHFGVKHAILSQPDCDFGTYMVHFKNGFSEAFLPTEPSLKRRLFGKAISPRAQKTANGPFDTEDRIQTVIFYQMLEKALNGSFSRFACNPGYDHKAMLTKERNRLQALDFKGVRPVLRAIDACIAMPFEHGRAIDIAQSVSPTGLLSLVAPVSEETLDQAALPAVPVSDQDLAKYIERVRVIDDDFSLERMERILAAKLPLENAPTFRSGVT
ncbi:hypothetical protein [Planktotalea sp.]|uniref:hypothetical protein n=1 Tax=Planktotalea sp. TaxID=2029877 RepID=UPI003299CD81